MMESRVERENDAEGGVWPCVAKAASEQQVVRELPVVGG